MKRKDIYDDLKLKKTFGFLVFIKYFNTLRKKEIQQSTFLVLWIPEL